MNPIVHVLYHNGTTYRFEEREAQGRLDSVDPVDFGLPASHSIILVLHRPQHLAAWLEGVPARG